MKQLRAVLFGEYVGQGKNVCVVQMLEHDIGAQGGNVDAAIERLKLTYGHEKRVAESLGKTIDDIERAPQKFFDAYEKAPKPDYEVKEKFGDEAECSILYIRKAP